MLLTRRTLLSAGAALALAEALPPGLGRADDESASALGLSEDVSPFRPAMVRERARELAAVEFVAPKDDLPARFAEMEYRQYQDIRFRSEAAVWRGEDVPFHLHMRHRGNPFRDRATVHVVSEWQSRRLLFSPKAFDYGPLAGDEQQPDTDLDFSGFSVQAPFNDPTGNVELAIFHGATYFRSVGAGQRYGTAARGLALATADPQGEETPVFREFWIERPQAHASVLVVHALLDSPSVAGAYRFSLRPGLTTAMDVQMTLYPRGDLDRVGLAPLNGMFLFAPHDRADIHDFRPAVHNCDGLLIWNGRGEWLWRPILNPNSLQISNFLDEHLHGFGLLQRERDFGSFQDLSAGYHRRPSVWVEPVGDWGSGNVTLIEIPSVSEMHDNVVAFWRPREPLVAGEGHQFAYRLHWGDGVPVEAGLARVSRTMVGQTGSNNDRRIVVIEFAASEEVFEGKIAAEVAAGGEAVAGVALEHNPYNGNRRVAFQLAAPSSDSVDLRCVLKRDGQVVSEVWTFRWSN
jgi:periplasmic glucans biosynthesis protein